MSKRRKQSGLWQYLDETGILEKGSPDDIALAKRAYWKTYFSRYRKERREKCPEFIVSLSREKGEYGKVALAAKRHKLTITAFLRAAALAYVDQTFLVPDTERLAHVEQLVSQCLNEVQILAKAKNRSLWEVDEKYQAIERRIEQLEQDISAIFRHPLSIESSIRQAIQKSPELRARLRELLT
ncbi:MAG: hypothetical protein FD123_421 [Bacteroidetes bacterium]|nr:MAG: hypothetical protein FD123_421 [Bacteroidota bacterium]